jgi:drug/metabolite transporter (DMT)-like permease
MMLVSVGMYSLVRATKAYKLPPIINTFAMISLPVPIYGLAVITGRIHYSPTLAEIAVMVLQGLVLIYFGNLYALRGIEAAPNPGYSVLISKMYVVFTAPVSIILFDSSLSCKSIMGILLILCFSYLVIVEKKSIRKASSASWVVSTLVAFFCFGGIALTSKYLLSSGVPILIRLLIPGILASVLYLPAAKKAFKKIEWNSKISFLLIGIALCSIGFNSLMQYAFAHSPNVGLVNAANAGSTALLAVTSALFFHDHLSKRKLLGIVGVLCGVFLLFL